ncbi:MAG: hypothetical protein EU530_03915 [Promethearchaeota archaeon]|nr:MAG: hypothetical protein EU530_03915 [Candidatus Lokiarchaeota archaeon]
MSDFSIRDELYLQEYYPPFHTLLFTHFKGQKVPLSWEKSYGTGTVFYLALGHGTAQINHPSIQKIIKNVIVYWSKGRRDK